jgi:hypothetical protein
LSEIAGGFDASDLSFLTSLAATIRLVIDLSMYIDLIFSADATDIRFPNTVFSSLRPDLLLERSSLEVDVLNAIGLR